MAMQEYERETCLLGTLAVYVMVYSSGIATPDPPNNNDNTDSAPASLIDIDHDDDMTHQYPLFHL